MANQVSVRDQALYYTGSWNPGTVTSTGTATTSVTIQGVSLGDIVIPSFAQATNGAKLQANVNAANTVYVRLVNDTGAELALTTAELKVVALRLSL